MFYVYTGNHFFQPQGIVDIGWFLSLMAHVWIRSGNVRQFTDSSFLKYIKVTPAEHAAEMYEKRQMGVI